MKTATKKFLAILLCMLTLTSLFSMAAFADRIPAGIISEAEAKRISLAKAGLTESDVIWWDIDFDYDDGEAEYDVDFRVGTTFYNCEINAFTGEIKKFYSRSNKFGYGFLDFFINLWNWIKKLFGVEVIV